MKPADLRWRVRAVKQEGPRWPLAFELAMLGTPIGVWLCPVPGERFAAVTTDVNGELFELRRLPVRYLVRWCLNRHLRIHHALADLVEAQLRGLELGWVPGRIVECKGGRSWPAPAIAFDCTLPGEPLRAEAVPVELQDVFG